MQILPSKELMSFIKHYLFLESEKKSIKKLRLFSDGNTGMVFSFKSNLISNIQNNALLDYLPTSFVYGQISEFKDLYLVNEASLIIVVFQPAGINQLMGVSAAELRDNIIRTEDLFGWQGLNLPAKLFEQSNVQGKLKILNAFFIELATKKVFVNQVLIDASVNFIFKNKGANSINQLVKHVGYTERHIERTFIECIGLSPKKFGNIVKLHSFLKLLKDKSTHNNLTKISYEAGYSDQSHLIKEFKKYTGITPKEYLYKTNKLTINFMEFDASHSTVEAMSGLYNLLRKP
jgi:AraC-like DNA-binding protein